MNRLWKISLLCALWLFPASIRAQSSLASIADTCDCPKLSCDSECEIEQAVNFYSEKCPGDKVRSCARPTCVKIDPFPQKCIDKLAKSTAPQNLAQLDQAQREVASVPEAPKVGAVEGLVGQAWKLQNKEKKIPLDLGSLVNEKDVIQTGKASRVEIAFDDGNKITLSENSHVELSEVLITPEESKKRTLLKLLRGKIRSQVGEDAKKDSMRKPSQSSTGNDFKFKVQTPSAVAGVRGTDFVVFYDEDEKLDQASTQVSTFKGLVELRGHERADKSLVGANETGSFVEKGIQARLSGQNFLQKAYLTPVRKMTKEENKKLKEETVLTGSSLADRMVASVDVSATCEAPKGDFNQCSWTCMNNPGGEKTCRTDMPGVECVRRVCKANGQWQDQTRLPASFGHYCDPGKPAVGPCDY